MLFWIALFGLEDFAIKIYFGREKPEHANAPIEWGKTVWTYYFCAT